MQKFIGFTIIEMLVVIAIIGILSAMTLVSSSEATNAAKVTKIIEGLRNISNAAMMAYADKKTEAGTWAKGDESKLIAAITPYLKKGEVLTKNTSDVLDAKQYYEKYGETKPYNGRYIIDATIKHGGKYVIEIADDSSWWVGYNLQETRKIRRNLSTNIDEYNSGKIYGKWADEVSTSGSPGEINARVASRAQEMMLTGEARKGAALFTKNDTTVYMQIR